MALHARCPNEISSQIVSFLSQHNLTSMSRVSHQMHEISQPVLYKEPCIITGSNSPPSLSILLRTLLTPGRETLSRHVRWLTLHWTDMQYVPSQQSEREDALLTAAASSLGIANPLTSAGAQVVLLLHLLTRLHTLHVIPPHDRDSLDEFLSTDHAIPAALQSVREFRWYSADSASGVSPTMLLTLLRLPSIRIIDIHMVAEIEVPFPITNGDAATNAMGTSTATHLEFTFGDISSWSLTRIMRVPRALTHFTYRAISGNRMGFGDMEFGLAPMQSTLQHLDLDLFRCIGRRFHGAVQSVPICSLREWPVLRNVRCSLMVLVGQDKSRLADVLPRGLRALETVIDSFWTAEEVVHETVVMLQRKNEMLVGLKSVAVHVDWPKRPDIVERLGTACRGVDVELVEGRAKPFL